MKFTELYHLEEAKAFKTSDDVVNSIKDGTMIKYLNGKKFLPDWINQAVNNEDGYIDIDGYKWTKSILKNWFDVIIDRVKNLNKSSASPNDAIVLLIKKSVSPKEFADIVSNNIDSLIEYTQATKSPWAKELPSFKAMVSEPYNAGVWHQFEKDAQSHNAQNAVRRGNEITDSMRNELYTTLYEDKEWGLYVPKSQKGDSELASHMVPFHRDNDENGTLITKTQWCTAAEQCYYSRYTSANNHLYVIKHYNQEGVCDEAWQAAFCQQDGIEIKDKYDEEYDELFNMLFLQAPAELLKLVKNDYADGDDEPVNKLSFFDYTRCLKEMNKTVEKFSIHTFYGSDPKRLSIIEDITKLPNADEQVETGFYVSTDNLIDYYNFLKYNPDVKVSRMSLTGYRRIKMKYPDMLKRIVNLMRQYPNDIISYNIDSEPNIATIDSTQLKLYIDTLHSLNPELNDYIYKRYNKYVVDMYVNCNKLIQITNSLIGKYQIPVDEKSRKFEPIRFIIGAICDYAYEGNYDLVENVSKVLETYVINFDRIEKYLGRNNSDFDTVYNEKYGGIQFVLQLCDMMEQINTELNVYDMNVGIDNLYKAGLDTFKRYITDLYKGTVPPYSKEPPALILFDYDNEQKAWLKVVELKKAHPENENAIDRFYGSTRYDHKTYPMYEQWLEMVSNLGDGPSWKLYSVGEYDMTKELVSSTLPVFKELTDFEKREDLDIVSYSYFKSSLDGIKNRLKIKDDNQITEHINKVVKTLINYYVGDFAKDDFPDEFHEAMYKPEIYQEFSEQVRAGVIDKEIVNFNTYQKYTINILKAYCDLMKNDSRDTRIGPDDIDSYGLDTVKEYMGLSNRGLLKEHDRYSWNIIDIDRFVDNIELYGHDEYINYLEFCNEKYLPAGTRMDRNIKRYMDLINDGEIDENKVSYDYVCEHTDAECIDANNNGGEKATDEAQQNETAKQAAKALWIKDVQDGIIDGNSTPVYHTETYKNEHCFYLAVKNGLIPKYGSYVSKDHFPASDDINLLKQKLEEYVNFEVEIDNGRIIKFDNFFYNKKEDCTLYAQKRKYFGQVSNKCNFVDIDFNRFVKIGGAEAYKKYESEVRNKDVVGFGIWATDKNWQLIDNEADSYTMIKNENPNDLERVYFDDWKSLGGLEGYRQYKNFEKEGKISNWNLSSYIGNFAHYLPLEVREEYLNLPPHEQDIIHASAVANADNSIEMAKEYYYFSTFFKHKDCIPESYKSLSKAQKAQLEDLCKAASQIGCLDADDEKDIVNIYAKDPQVLIDYITFMKKHPNDKDRLDLVSFYKNRRLFEQRQFFIDIYRLSRI